MKAIMKRAHEIARTLEGDYSARLALALKSAWREAKNPVKVVVKKATEKAKMLVLQFTDITGTDREFNVWFPNGWLHGNNMPKHWALEKKADEVASSYRPWGLCLDGVLRA